MSRFRTRFTTRSLMIAVALVGLNLAGAIATAKLHHGWANHDPGLVMVGIGTRAENVADILSKEGQGLKPTPP